MLFLGHTKMKSLVLVFLAGSVSLVAGECGEIYEHGISAEGNKTVLDLTNHYRSMVTNGEVPDQPRGTNLLEMRYDDPLAQGATDVSTTCTADHIIRKDDRFAAVGQNIFATWGSSKNCTQDWQKAVDGWFNEYKEFGWPDKKLGKGPVGHYTQLVWAETFLMGCDFICFNDPKNSKNPYARIYTCNYGPGGNVLGEEPYKRGDAGCEGQCDPEKYPDTIEEYDY